jgi:VanZ family protein
VADAVDVTPARREAWWRALFWLAVVAGVVLALWPQPDSEPWFPQSDKVKHALSFAVLVGLGVRGGYRRWWSLVAGLLLLGGAIEVAQSFTATRSAEWLDWFADAIGIAIGWIGTSIEARSQRGRSAAQEQEDRR